MKNNEIFQEKKMVGPELKKGSVQTTFNLKKY
jgi:hypothetical protein